MTVSFGRGYVAGEAEAVTEGHFVPIADSRLPADAETSRSALTVADTVLALGFEVSFDAAAWSLSSEADRALVWDCHWPCASVLNAVSFVLTSARSALSSSPIPCPTLTSVRVVIEARRAAASWHSADVGPGAAADGAADDGTAGAVDALPPPYREPFDPQAATSSAAPAATATACHRGGLMAVTRLMLPASSPAGGWASPAWGYLGGYASRPARWSPTRSALAMAVSAGFTAPMLGKKLVSTTYRLSSSWALQLVSRTEVAGSEPNLTVPAWCATPAIGISFLRYPVRGRRWSGCMPRWPSIDLSWWYSCFLGSWLLNV